MDRKAPRSAVALLASILSLAPGGAAGQTAAREPVLAQVRVPHAYYWREMYVPQLTSGPSAATWSPDGRALVYSMQGALWRQRVGDSVAVQLTNGPDYDFQPDWSPDGRWIAYTSYDGSQLRLRSLDLATGDTGTLFANGAVNVEPRWSPDGSRLAFVSSGFEGRWHIFVAAVTNTGRLSASRMPVAPAPIRLDSVVRVTEDRDSGLPRYYYGAFDQYLSPTWSPDGRELIVVSNRGHVNGSGGLWRMEARAGAAMHEVHYEETAWKARPDWAADGRRVVYSSYAGRQWNQLALVAADGGDPVPLTYGDFDATGPRWSRDGRRIAYVSNEGGNTSLWVLDVPGGTRRRIEARVRRFRRPMARLALEVVDSATGAPLPARLSVRSADGRYFAPDGAWQHADEALVRGEQRFEYGYWHGGGRDTVTVPVGRVTVEAWHGPEFGVVRRQVLVGPGGRLSLRLALPRLADLARQGWYGGDLHVHMNYGGAYRNTPAHLALQARAEGLQLVENLIVNKEQRIPDLAYWRPGVDPVSRPDFVLAHAQEFHTVFWGHLGLLGLRDHYLLPDYAGYPGTALASLAPTNADIADLAHAQHGLVGYVHPFDFRPDLATIERGVPYELPIDVALGKVDYYEVMGFSDHLATSEVWYRLLNLGFRLPAGAGTDAFPNFAALRGPPGLVRVYAHAGPMPRGLDHDRWLNALKAGRTMVTNGPLVSLSLRDARGRSYEPGDDVRVEAGGGTLRARITLRSAIPVDHLELIGDGAVRASLTLHAGGTAADTTIVLPVSRSGWYVVRAYADRARLPVLDLYPFASTSAVYVTVAGAAPRSAADADYFLRWLERAEQGIRDYPYWTTPAERDAALAQLGAARTELSRRR